MLRRVAVLVVGLWSVVPLTAQHLAQSAKALIRLSGTDTRVSIWCFTLPPGLLADRGTVIAIDDTIDATQR